MASSFELGELPSPRLKRPPSYSDSYYVLGGTHTPTLESISSLQTINSPVQPSPVVPPPAGPRIQLFAIKSAIHLFFISVFETIFFFYYVSVTENNGILATIDTYYTPLIDTCPNWPPIVKEALNALLTQNQTYTDIVLQGQLGLSKRTAGNQTLLEESLIASGVCFTVVLLGSIWLRIKEVPVRWWVVFGENISMVVLLGLYEYFFFRVIIYNYGTLSTPELNAYLVKGVYGCVSS